MKVQIRASELVDVEELLSSIQELLSRVLGTLLLTVTLLLSSFSFTVFTFANSFYVLICIVEYVGACPSSDFPRGGPTRRLLLLFDINFLSGIFGVNFFLSGPLFSLLSLLSLGIKIGSLICLYLQLSPKGHLFT